MKIRIYISFTGFFVCTLLGAQTTTAFIVDNSGSSDTSKVVLKEKYKNIFAVLLDRVKENGDRVLVSFIYENSASVSNQKLFVYNYRRPVITSTKPNVIKAKNQEYDRKEKNAKIAFFKKVARYAFAHELNRPATHILSTLSLIESWQQQYGSLELVFFSDMIEASDKFRYLASTKFTTVEEAEQTGRADAQKVAHTYGLGDSFLRDVSITIWLPVEDMANATVFRWVKPYWQGVFSSFGLSSSHLKFQ